MELITLQIYDTAIAARIIKNRLESEDIRCYILDENIVTLDPLLNYAVGGIRLQVNKEDLERAKSILAEIDDTPLTDDQDEVIECPNCQSTQLYTDFKSIKDPKGFLAMIAAFIFTVFPVYSKSVYKCKECNTEFDKK
jgi:hypothetical protein